MSGGGRAEGLYRFKNIKNGEVTQEGMVMVGYPEGGG
jgi:hypothetical protein